MISAKNLSKSYPVTVKSPGLKGTLTHFFHRTYREIKAVHNISFTIEAGEVVGFSPENFQNASQQAARILEATNIKRPAQRHTGSYLVANL